MVDPWLHEQSKVEDFLQELARLCKKYQLKIITSEEYSIAISNGTKLIVTDISEIGPEGDK